jgi:hypothetical protein
MNWTVTAEDFANIVKVRDRALEMAKAWTSPTTCSASCATSTAQQGSWGTASFRGSPPDPNPHTTPLGRLALWRLTRATERRGQITGRLVEWAHLRECFVVTRPLFVYQTSVYRNGAGQTWMEPCIGGELPHD